MNQPRNCQAQRGPDERELPNSTPVALRWPFLICLALYICGLISALEYGRRAFPMVESRTTSKNGTGQFGPFISAPLIRVRETSLAQSEVHRHWYHPLPSPIPRKSVEASEQPVRRRGNKMRSNETSVEEANTSGTASISDSSTSAAAASARPTRASHWNSTVEPIQFGYRKGYPPSYLNGTQHVLSPGRRHADPDHYGELVGNVQKIMLLQSNPGDDSRIFSITYFADNTKLSDVLTPEEIEISKYKDLCKIRCSGAAIIFIDDLCWSMWSEAAEYSRWYQAQGGIWSFSEIEKGGTQCPLPDAPSTVVPTSSPTYATVDIVEIITISGVPATTTRHTRVPLQPETTVLRDGAGRPTTVTRWPSNVATRLTTMTISNAEGSSAATLTTNIRLISTVLTLLDAQGRATATVTTDIPDIVPQPSSTDPSHWGRLDGGALPEYFHPISWSSYLCSTFLPVLLSIPLSIAAQMISAQLKTLLPFHALMRPRGATAGDSLCMDTGGFAGVLNSFHLLLRFKEPLSLLKDLIILCSAVVISFSSEAVGIKLYGTCEVDNFKGCYMGIAVFNAPSLIVQVFLSLMLVLVSLMYLLRGRWRTGVPTAPQSIAGLASLVQDDRTRQLLRDIHSGEDKGYITNRQMIEKLNGKIFYLGCVRHAVHNAGYTIATKELESDSVTSLVKQAPTRSTSGITKFRARVRIRYLDHPSRVELIIRGVFVSVLCSFFILIIYYESTQLDTPFERFMDNQNFGVRALFTGLGVIISFFWEYYFFRVSTLEPYRRLARRPQLAENSISLSPSTTPLVGLFRSLIRGDWVIATVACTAVLSTFTPILLSNIPFSPIQTWTTHQVCAWAAVAFLGLMILVLVFGWVFIKYPYMPVDPSTLAGRMYYICDSEMVDDSTLKSNTGEKLRDSKLQNGKKYKFGDMIGVSGEKRVGVDHAEDNKEHGLLP